ncbi:MAG: hypothetical protein ACO3FE_16525, partial [Planctomycetaceae bacterium]
MDGPANRGWQPEGEGEPPSRAANEQAGTPPIAEGTNRRSGGRYSAGLLWNGSKSVFLSPPLQQEIPEGPYPDNKPWQQFLPDSDGVHTRVRGIIFFPGSVQHTLSASTRSSICHPPLKPTPCLQFGTKRKSLRMSHRILSRDAADRIRCSPILPPLLPSLFS